MCKPALTGNLNLINSWQNNNKNNGVFVISHHKTLKRRISLFSWHFIQVPGGVYTRGNVRKIVQFGVWLAEFMLSRTNSLDEGTTTIVWSSVQLVPRFQTSRMDQILVTGLDSFHSMGDWFRPRISRRHQFSSACRSQQFVTCMSLLTWCCKLKFCPDQLWRARTLCVFHLEIQKTWRTC